jgi:DNA polymerase-3 subunit beta
MKLTILKEKLSEGLRISEKVTKKLLSLPVLQNCLLETEKSFLKISSTNLETGVNYWSLAKIEKEGKICIPAKIFSQIIDFLPSEKITIYEENFTLNIEDEKINMQINGVSPEEFPIIPEYEKIEPIVLENSSFCKNLNSISKIPTPSSARPEISGILISFRENIMEMVATDSFRLANKKSFLPENFSQKISFILPQISAREFLNIFSSEEGELKIYPSPSQVWFEVQMLEVKHPKIRYTSRVIEGEYPNYEEIIPKKFNTQIEVSKEEFLKQIKTASFLSSKNNEVKIKIDPKNQTVKILSQNLNLGRYEGSIKGKVKGDELEITFNWKFLNDGVSEIETDEFIFRFTDQEGPAMITPLGKEDYFYILMPIKAS